MKKILELITEEFAKAFEAKGYDESLAIVGVSNRPDLCEYQCNGAMAGAKKYGKAPITIAEEIVDEVKDNKMFSKVILSTIESHCSIFLPSQTTPRIILSSGHGNSVQR